MSHFPKDSFDDVEPYAPGEAGKHREMTARGPGARRGGGMKWIALFAVFALLVGAFGYFVYPRITGDQTTTTAESGPSEEGGSDADGESPGPDATETPDGGEEGGPEDGGESATPNEDEGDDGEDVDTSDDPTTAADTTTPIQVANLGGPDGGASSLGGQLQELDYNVVWEGPWGFGDLAVTPVVLYPAGASEAEQAIAQDLAENLDVASVQEHPQVTYVTYVLGPEYSG